MERCRARSFLPPPITAGYPERSLYDSIASFVCCRAGARPRNRWGSASQSLPSKAVPANSLIVSESGFRVVLGLEQWRHSGKSDSDSRIITGGLIRASLVWQATNDFS